MQELRIKLSANLGRHCQRPTDMHGPVAVQHEPDDGRGSFREQADMDLREPVRRQPRAREAPGRLAFGVLRENTIREIEREQASACTFLERPRIAVPGNARWNLRWQGVDIEPRFGDQEQRMPLSAMPMSAAPMARALSTTSRRNANSAGSSPLRSDSRTTVRTVLSSMCESGAGDSTSLSAASTGRSVAACASGSRKMSQKIAYMVVKPRLAPHVAHLAHVPHDAPAHS